MAALDRDTPGRLLEYLPRLEDYGAARLLAEVEGDPAVVVLPLTGFVPLRGTGDRLVPATDEPVWQESKPLDRFRCAQLRLGLAVTGNIVLTARLPDRIVPPPEPGEACGTLTDRPTVLVRTRHLEKRREDIQAIDMATAIMRYLTGTCTAVVRDVQDQLTAVERQVLAEGAADAPDFDPTAPLRQIHHLGQLADHMSRELSRSMRRMPELDKAPTEDTPQEQLVRRATNRVKNALEELRHLQTELSFAGSTMTNLVAVRQLRAAEDQRDNSEDFQQMVSKLGAVVLIPALIAALWGANVWLPGQQKELGFVALLLLMVSGAIAVWQVMESRWQRRRKATGRGGQSVRHRRTPPSARAMYQSALVLLVAGLVLFGVAGLVASDPTGRTTNASRP